MKRGRYIKRKIGAAILLSGMLFTLSGCGLFPEEAQINEPLKVPHFSPAIHETVKVEKGNLDCSETVDLIYHTQESKNYYLKYIPDENSWDYGIKTYVVKGDFVKKGQLLVEAPCEDIETEISGYQEQISSMGLDISYNQKLLELATDSEEKESYKSSISDMKAQIEVLNLRVKEATDRLNEYRIYADMDGQISDIIDLSMEGYIQTEPFLTIVSPNGSFVGEANSGACKLKVGDKTPVTVSSDSYEMTVKDIEEINDGLITISLQAEGQFSEGNRGKLELIGEKAENVLYVPEKAVVIDDEKTYVRVVGEDGFLRAKQVTTSSLINGYYVIESGLEEGEEVVNE